MKRPTLTRFIWLSIAAAVLTIGLKSLAYFVTGSVGLLSDALESVVNLIAAVVAFIMLKIAEKPPDEEHEYGHTKAEYFASVLEGLFIIIAAISIGYAAIERLIHPRAIEQTFIGLGVSVIASLINLAVAQILLKEGKKHRSITLQADGKHLMTDVWTSVGVIVGVALVALTNIQILDPIIAIAVAANIIITGFDIMKQSTYGLMDGSMPIDEVNQIKDILNKHCIDDITYHGLKTRESATRSFVSVHILVPGKWSVQKGHDLLEVIEKDICRQLSNVVVFTHLEPLEDPSAHDEDTFLGK
jgi:cation diffusion facilitator family transporter